MKYGYCRCSTNELKQEIDRQIREVKNMGAETVFFEYETGIKRERQELNKLLNIIKENDTIFITEVSRISRSTKDLLDILEICKEKKVKIVINTFVVDFTKPSTDPMTIALVQLMGVFSQMEREIIVERIVSGLKNAKAKGVKLGRPNLSKDNIPITFYKYYAMYKNKQINITELTRLSNLKSRTTTYKYIKMIENEV